MISQGKILKENIAEYRIYEVYPILEDGTELKDYVSYMVEQEGGYRYVGFGEIEECYEWIEKRKK